MASYNELLALIDAYINQNGVQAITGQVLNGVLRAMVDQLGRGYSIMGAADPTTDPGTPDGPETWFASVPGTYTNFDGIQIVPGELALLSYEPSTGFSKNTIYEGFQTVQATIDGNVGTPAVGVSYANGILSFDFHNMKGVTGDPAGFGAVTASVDSNIGTPSVQVQTSGPDTAKAIAFQFHNLKGETGVTSVLATVDNTSGNPQCAVSLNGQQLVLNFTGLKGAQGDTGSSVDYPFTIVNNLTTNDATQALSAAMGVQLESEVSQLEAKEDRIVPSFSGNLVNQDDPDFVDGAVDDSDGTIRTTGLYLSDYKATAYIPVIPGNTYIGYRTRWFAWYKSDKTYLSGGTSFNTATIAPANAAFLRVSIYKTYLSDASVTEGSVVDSEPFGQLKASKLPIVPASKIGNNAISSEKIENDAVTNTKIATGAVSADKADFMVVGVNKLNKANSLDGYRLDSADGIPDEQSGYYTTDFLQVTAGTVYRFSALDHYVTVAKVCWYKADKTYINNTGSGQRYATSPENAAFVRFSFSTANWPYGMLYTGTTLANYVPYSVTLIPSYIGKESITEEKLAVPVKPNKLSAFLASASLDTNETINTPQVHIGKNATYVFRIGGVLDVVFFGYDYNANKAYQTYFLKLTQTAIIECTSDNGSAMVEGVSRNHGLTLDAFTTISVKQGTELGASIRIANSAGDAYEFDVSTAVWLGNAWLSNKGTGTIDAKVSLMPRDITKDVWIFGDSYCGYWSGGRWPYYPFNVWGYDVPLLNNKPGITAGTSITDLENLLALGYKPKHLVWTLGMNGGDDPDTTTINTTQKGWIDSVVSICEQYGIEPIFFTIPSVNGDGSLILHHALSDYIRNLGFRYVDIAEAVGSDTSGNWYPGLLSSDGVHPTQAGAKVIATRVLSDYPEIMIK